MKQKMDDLKKAKLVYSGELIIIGIIFLVLGILKILGIMSSSDTSRTIFNWITIFGGSWIIFDFFWSNFSSKRRQKVCLLDKYLGLPAGIYVIVIDILSFTGNASQTTWKYFIAGLFFYITVNYIFQGFFHYKHPTPELLRAVEEDRKVEEEKASQAVQEEQTQEANNQTIEESKPEDK